MTVALRVLQAPSEGEWNLLGQRHLFRHVVRKIAASDPAYHSSDRQYFETGASGLSAVLASLKAVGRDPAKVAAILDYRCGYGRVLRWLKVGFPEAGLLASDTNQKALAAVSDLLHVKTRLADPQLSAPLGKTFDLIWCGSFITQLAEDRSRRAITYLGQHLNPGGLLVFSTHGPYVARRIRTGEKLYGLTADQAGALLREYDARGYGFGLLADGGNFGISAAKPSSISGMIEESGLRLAHYVERGWASHQDVYGVTR